jgi:magnesium transporter
MISMLTTILNSQQADEIIHNGRMSFECPVTTENLDSHTDASFEIKAYEAILDTVVRMHRQEFSRIERSIQEVLAKTKKRAIIPAQLQEKMRGLKNSLSSISARVSAHRRAIDEILDHDVDMAVMNLTRLKNKPSLCRMPLGLEIMSYHEDIEVLIDSNFIDTTSLETELELLRDEVRGSEESVLLRLDTSRNQLLIANTQIAVCGTFAAVGSLIASMFGMNLTNHEEEGDKAWLYVTSVTCAVIVSGIFLTFVLLRKSGVIPNEA